MSVVTDQMDRDIIKANTEIDRLTKALKRLEDHAEDHKEAIENQEAKLKKLQAHKEETEAKEAESSEDTESDTES